MKRLSLIFTLLCLALLSSTPTMAQDEAETTPSKQTFRFVYTAMDPSIPLQALLKDLQDAYNHALLEGPAIFYLANGSEPIIVKVNMSDDNRDDFEERLLNWLRQNTSSSVDGSYDKQRILELLKEYNFVDNERNLIYGSTYFVFNVGQSFWTMSNNEVLIAAMYFELDLSFYLANDRFRFNVICPRSIEIDENNPFGILNPDNINETINVRKNY
ncbi:MAG: hypothetical protein IJP74_04995 [Prevotella sp.]|nr:hypothetical protein [Prevotella sp.]